MNRFADWLTKQRESRGWTQVEFARFLGCAQSMVARWEAGECYPGLAQFRALVRLLCADANEVLRLIPDSRDNAAA